MDEYVSNAAWLAGDVRADAIDDIADQFERPTGAATFWNEVSVRRTIREATLAPRVWERRAG